MTVSEVSKSLLTKNIEDHTEEELEALQHTAARELGKRCLDDLEVVASQYIRLHGKKEGVEQMGEHLCKVIAQRQHPDGWDGLVKHLLKISG